MYVWDTFLFASAGAPKLELAWKRSEEEERDTSKDCTKLSRRGLRCCTRMGADCCTEAGSDDTIPSACAADSAIACEAAGAGAQSPRVPEDSESEEWDECD
jgi:hypothetical protein